MNWDYAFPRPVVRSGIAAASKQAASPVMKKFRLRDVIARETRTEGFSDKRARSRGGQRGRSEIKPFKKAVRRGAREVQGRRRTWGIDPRPLAEVSEYRSGPAVSLPRGRTRPFACTLADGGQRDSRSARGTRQDPPSCARGNASGRVGLFFLIQIGYFRQRIAGRFIVAREADILYRNNVLPQAHDASPRGVIYAR